MVPPRFRASMAAISASRTFEARGPERRLLVAHHGVTRALSTPRLGQDATPAVGNKIVMVTWYLDDGTITDVFVMNFQTGVVSDDAPHPNPPTGARQPRHRQGPYPIRVLPKSIEA